MFSLSKLVRLVFFVGACTIYFIHLHHVTDVSHSTWTTAGRDPTVVFGVQFYSTLLHKMERGIVKSQSQSQNLFIVGNHNRLTLAMNSY